MFVISLTYIRDLDEVDKYLSSHIDYLEKEYSKGSFIASGRKVPRTGGVILSNVSSRAELDQMLDADPFKQNGVAEYNVIEFTPTKTSTALDFLRQ